MQAGPRAPEVLTRWRVYISEESVEPQKFFAPLGCPAHGPLKERWINNIAGKL